MDSFLTASRQACGPQLQSHKRTLSIAEITDDLAERLRQLSHQCRNRNDLITGRQLRMYQKVDYFDSVLAR